MNASRLWASTVCIAALLAASASISARTPTAQPPPQTVCSGSAATCGNVALRLVPAYASGSIGAKAIWPHSEQLVADAKARSQKAADVGAVNQDGKDTYRTELGGTTYYMTANSYGILTQAQLNAMTDTSTKLYPGACAFYLYNAKQEFSSSFVITVGSSRRGTHCNAISGVSGVAFHGQPALLAIVQYFYTNGKAANSVAQFGANWIQTTVLLPLNKQANGKWAFTQDFTCFPRTNMIKTLAQAERYMRANCQ